MICASYQSYPESSDAWERALRMAAQSSVAAIALEAPRDIPFKHDLFGRAVLCCFAQHGAFSWQPTAQLRERPCSLPASRPGGILIEAIEVTKAGYQVSQAKS